MDFTLQARWVVPLAGPPIDSGRVVVAQGAIVEVGRRAASGQIEDLGDVVLLPGLVNAHAHLEFSGLDRPLGASAMPLPAWIRTVIAHRRSRQAEVDAAIAAGLRESLTAGVTTIADIATGPAYGYAGVRGPRLTLLQEAIGFSRQRVESVADEVRQWVDQAAASYPHQVGVSPHAPYTVHPELLAWLVGFASKHELPVAMHLAESREELELLACGAGPFQELLEERSMWDPHAIARGSRPLDYLKVLARAPRTLVVHGNFLNGAEIDFLAHHRDTMSVVFCPRTHRYFGHPPHPLPELLKRGVRVALGTDSRASNPDLSLLAEVQTVHAIFPDIAPATVVRMATDDAAAALGMGHAAGQLAPGRSADLVAVSCEGAGADPFAAIASPTAKVAAVWCAGDRVK